MLPKVLNEKVARTYVEALGGKIIELAKDEVVAMS